MGLSEGDLAYIDQLDYSQMRLLLLELCKDKEVGEKIVTRVKEILSDVIASVDEGIVLKSEKAVVPLAEIADKLDEVMDTWEQYLNSITGEFVSISDGSWAETDEELAEEIEFSDDYIRLPNQHEINEYKIMEDFAVSCPDSQESEQLLRALAGKKPFRRFKDTLSALGLAEEYYKFRDLAFLDIAREWCEDHGIPYEEK